MEKSTIGLYRSLLVQLLEAKPALEHVLHPFRPGHEWTVESLRSVLEEAAQDLEDTSIICTIDALDECDQGQIRDMVSFFETLAHNHRSLQICFASRHYPHINIRTGLSIILEEREGHREDITTYLSSALTIGHSKRAEKIRSTLQEKARGVFMWVILVVEILNKDYDAGDVLELEERIKQLPEDLHALFRDILTRDTKNRQALLLCIQWILYAKDPLTPTQLYLAILSGSDQKSLSKWNSHDHEEADARRYILDKSKGLVEVTKAKIPTVQFIHESVNDFLLKEKGLARLSSDDVGPNVQGSSHEALKLCCLTYIDSEAVSKYKEWWTEWWTQSSRDDAMASFPLLAYANYGMLYHAEQAGNRGIDQSDFLATFQRSDWVQRHNVLEKFEKRRYTPDVSLLYILAEAGLPTLIRAHSQRQSCHQIEAERYGIPILAASSMKHGPTTEVMLELEAGRMPSFDFQEFSRRFPLRRDDLNGTSLNFEFKKRRDLPVQVIEYGSDIVSLFYVMAKELHTEWTEGKKHVLLEVAFKSCKTDVVKFLLGCGCPIPRTYSDGQTPLHYASSGGCIELAKLLLDYGSEIMATNDHGKTPLHLASAADVAELLILRGSNIEATSGAGGTPLHDASRAGRVAVAQVLVDSGACVSAHNRFTGSTPLHTAAQHGSTSMMRFLIDNGASVLSTDKDGDTPLHDVWLSKKSAAAALDLLLKKGANISTPNNKGDTALNMMCRHGSDILASILIENGASVSVCNDQGKTPLHVAVQSLDEKPGLVKLLIKAGANVLAVDHDGNTPLHLLSISSATVAQILIDNGANVLATNKAGKTPLHCIAPRLHAMEMVRLLINHGASAMSVADNDGNTPLLVASRYGRAEIVRLLLGRNADVSAVNKDGETPLLAAWSGNHYDIVEMLRERMNYLSSNNAAIV